MSMLLSDKFQIFTDYFAAVLETSKSVKFTYCEKICVYSITLSVQLVGMCVCGSGGCYVVLKLLIED